jgi:putative component of membrane protein insertase Oxa1/YidC/SpoIIIJ protein YidD
VQGNAHDGIACRFKDRCGKYKQKNLHGLRSSVAILNRVSSIAWCVVRLNRGKEVVRLNRGKENDTGERRRFENGSDLFAVG